MEKEKSCEPIETVTPEIFETWDWDRQLDYVRFGDNAYLELFKKLNGPLNVEAEAKLIAEEIIPFADAKHKYSFQSDDWRIFLEKELAGEKELEQYFSWDKIKPGDWADLLTFKGYDTPMKKHCDFSRFDGSEWVTLLRELPQYVEVCPFELLEAEELDVILRCQPQLTSQSGLVSPVVLILTNSEPQTDPETDLPFLTFPEGRYAKDILKLVNDFVTDKNPDAKRLALNVIYRKETLLGVYASKYAMEKRKRMLPNLHPYPNLDILPDRVENILTKCANKEI